jgi:outer membrane protein OmpA-like peptidoglycan-associated protein
MCGFVLGACSSQPVAGPDKMFAGEGIGALEGAGAGAVTGAQVSAGAGPGAAVGAGLGAVLGAIHGLAKDQSEEAQLRTAARLKEEKSRALAQEILSEQYKRRMELHPTREIFPADLFFNGDSASMCPSGVNVVRELARMNAMRLPYSRLVVAVYAKSAGPESSYAQHLTERRSREFVNQLVRAGVQPRRLETRAVVMNAPILIDPLDDPTRYNQAIEIIPIDR